MRYLNSYKLFENKSFNIDDVSDIFSSVIARINLSKSVYKCESYISKDKELDICVIYGEKYGDSTDEDILKEIYHYRLILRNVYNLEYYFISLRDGKVIIVLYPYEKDSPFGNYKEKVDISIGGIPYSVFNNIPARYEKLINDGPDWRGRPCLREGIKMDTGTSNLALYNWQYGNYKEDGNR